MFTYSTIISEGSDLVAWHQSSNSARTVLAARFKTPSAGLYVDDLPGIDFDIIDDSLSEDYSDANDYLQKIHESELQQIIYDFTSRNKQILGSRDVLNNFDVTNGIADYTDLSTKSARFCGWLITPKKSNNVQTAIKKIGLQISTSESVRIFLYETSQQTAIATFDFTASSPLSLQWEAVTDFIINYRGDYGTNQAYLLGYYEHDPNNDQSYQLKGRAVEFEFDCGCNNSPKKHFGKYIDIQPIVIENDDLNGISLPNMNDITSYFTSVSYGLYAKMNVTCDITDVLVDNLTAFARAYQYKLAIRVLDDYLATVRLNPDSNRQRIAEFRLKARNQYYGELNGWESASGRWHRGLVEDLSIDFSGMDNVCLPCGEREPFIGHKARP